MDDAVESRTMNAHGHPKNHPYWNDPGDNEVKNFLEDCKDFKGIITFYPVVDGSICLTGEMYDQNKEMIQLFKDVNVLGQSINMITMLGNNSLQRSTGIIIQPDDTTLDMFNPQNVKKFVKVLSSQIYHFKLSQKQLFDIP